MSQPYRLRQGGRIDRDRTLLFTFDGKSYPGHPGDTLAAALLANGVRLVARSFKYHRPRGVLTAGPEEPNALVELRSGDRLEPNTRATTVEMFDGLAATSQNRWPSLDNDIGSINSRFSRFFAAGFYYKTFMWPQAAWERVYEPIIRRAAGLGRPPLQPDPDAYEHQHAHCDVLVVGSGAAGLAAALAAGRAGARVIVAEQDFELGGGLLLEPGLAAWRERTIGELAALPDVTILPRTTVFGLYDHNVVGAIERVADHLPVPAPHAVRQRYWLIRAKQIVLATGAIERFIAFPDNDRPGVMLASAAETYVKRYGVAPGRSVVLFLNNDPAYATAHALFEAGVGIAAILDARSQSRAADRAEAAGMVVRRGMVVAGTKGHKAIEAVYAMPTSGGSGETIPCDGLIVSGGHNPDVALWSHARQSLKWHAELATYVPAVGEGPGLRIVGAAAGVSGIRSAVAAGAAAGIGAVAAAGFATRTSSSVAPPDVIDATVTPLLPLWEVRPSDEGAARAKGKAFVDFQHDVTADDMRLAHREGYTHVQHAKRYTTHGMATDQGKTGGLIGVAVLAEARKEPIETVGLPTFRPYVTPVTWGAIAGRETGRHFKPTRRTPLHHWHKRHGAVFMETGLWLRPAYYTLTGETGWDPILREARGVRQRVGLCDVSTLGKIDIQGPDAAKLLDRLYTNTFSTLPIGRARYGLMLREDGIVFDDGTTSRLGPNHYLMTTTTAKAAEVLAHMEWYHQTAWPELDVRFCSVTDQWAQMSLAGPKARAVLERCVTQADVSNAALPFMGVIDARIAGAPVRLFRVSFSGELAYEIATPAGFGELVWETILAAGGIDGITLYGLEALNLLRIEKGHVTGAELNGQTTARDVGLHKMQKKAGDYIGRVLSEREGLRDPSRPRLVGIRALTADFDKRLRAGAHIVSYPESRESLGWVSSITRSVELDRWIGLALVRGGEDRPGQRLYATYPLKNEVIEVEITTPHHVDPENARVRA